jgi:F-type H+-transporting ATPase subunit delta
MAASKAAIRYAKALLDLTIEMKSLQKVYADVVMIDEICQDNRDFLAMLQSPIIQKRKKIEIYKALFDGKVQEITLNFLNLITSNSRENIIPQITESFIKQYKTNKGILEVSVKSAIALEENVKKGIIEKVQQHFKGEIELHEQVDQSLIGGFVVTIEDKQIDASIVNQLTNLKNILLN